MLKILKVIYFSCVYINFVRLIEKEDFFLILDKEKLKLNLEVEFL